MFGAYIADPNSPENLEKKKNAEVSAEQLETANKWSESMAELNTEAGAPEKSPEAELTTPEIPETEPALQGDALDGSDLPTDDATTPAEDSPLAGDALPADAPAAEMPTIADTPEAPAAAPAAEASAIQHFQPDEVKTDGESSFNPVSPDEQRANKIAAEAAHAKSYSEPGEMPHVIDEDNLVAKEVANSLGGGGSLENAYDKLDKEGVDKQGEANELANDISADMAAASTAGSLDNEAQDAMTANNLAVEAGSKAVAAKDAAAEAASAAKSGGDAALDAIERANKAADEAENLANLSEGVAAAAGTSGSAELVGQAREMAQDAKDIASAAEDAAEAVDEANEVKPGDEDKDGKKKAAFDNLAEKYPELEGMENPEEAGTITG